MTTTFTRLTLPHCPKCMTTGWACDAEYLVAGAYLCRWHAYLLGDHSQPLTVEAT